MSAFSICQNSRSLRLGMALALGLALLLGLLWLMGIAPFRAMALHQDTTILYVDGATGYDIGNDCGTSVSPCATIQHAVDAAAAGDEIRVATGIYTGVHARAGITQVAYISKTVTVRGGYTTTNWTAPYPLTQPITLDAQQRGRVLYITGASAPGAGISVTIEGLRITGGDATELGGGASGKDAGGGAYVVTATAIIRDNHVVTNTALIGGGMYFQNSDGTSLIDNLISDNSTSQGGSGGGLYLHNSAHATLTGNTISDNEAGPWSYGFGTGGGALFDNCPGVTLSENGVRGNRASWGGGLRFQDSATATLIANTISENVADHLGGGMKHYAGALFDHSDNATLIGNTISGNRTANHCGGVCFQTSHNAVLSGNVIVSNIRGPWWDGHGVGVYLNGSENASLVGNSISNNTAHNLDAPGTIRGGGLYIGHSTTELISNTISSNGATRGGGLYVASNSIVTLTSSTITGNAVYDACGVWCGGPKGTGGGLHLSDSAATLANTIIANNQVEIAGGGLYAERSAITLTNTIVADNQITLTGQITGTGSGLYIVGSFPRLLHTTIARNGGGDGSGVYITSTTSATSTVALTNTILVSHTVGITVMAGDTVILNGVLWYSNTINYGGEGTITVTNEYTGNPAFATDGYHLTSASAAIDEGVNAGVGDDIDGHSRPQGGGYDLGADELLTLYLPLVLRNP